MALPSSEPTTLLEALVAAIRKAGQYDRNDQVSPAAVLWTDKEKQWEPLLPVLRSQLPILTLGDYVPDKRIGPSYWIRCMLAGSLPEDKLPENQVPIIYLPGVSRTDLRAIEECPKLLQPIAELQYRGVLWTQRNGSDWTIQAFIVSQSGGLGIEVANDQATRDSMKRALLKLADEPIERLKKEAPLKGSFFDALLNPDETRSMLMWLNEPAGFKAKVDADEWQAFCNVCKSKYGFHPEKDGLIAAAQLLGMLKAPWNLVWNRFKESPLGYPNLPGLMRQACPHHTDLFDISETWPQDNESAEEQLLQNLASLSATSTSDARSFIEYLESQHSERRSWVWARLGQSHLAVTLEYLAQLVQLTEQDLCGSTIPDLMKHYTDWGWKVDEAVMQALAAVHKQGGKVDEISAVKTAIQVIYKPWLEAAAASFQKAVAGGTFSSSYPYSSIPFPEKSTCFIFSDALRMDAGQLLARAMTDSGYQVDVTPRLTALPAITMTSKPALAPEPNEITGKGAKGLNPVLSGRDTSLTADGLRKILQSKGFQILTEDDLGDPSGYGWIEMGEIDTYGHQHHCKLAVHMDAELTNLRNRIATLLDFGWQRVIVITDHGWLLFPGELPKAYLPEHLTEVRKGRCARLKDGSNTDQQTVPWHWDGNVRVAVAPNICCYESGKEYEHGGLSPQECITPVLSITKTGDHNNLPVNIESANWQNLRLKVKLQGVQSGMLVDVRTKAGDANTSLLNEPKAPNALGEVSLLVEDEDKLETAALIVVIDADGQVRAQIHTTVGN